MQAQLTVRQQAILERLRVHAIAGAPPPSLAQLCAELGLRSRGSLHKQVQALVTLGLVETTDPAQPGVRLTEEARRALVALPWIGDIAAGRPIEALANPTPMEVPAALRGRGECYVLRVRGDSMIEAGILDGDWVVVEKREQARNGEIVVALIDDREATLKRLQQTPGRVLLVPENATLTPVSYAPDRVRIQGVVVGQMRAYRR